MEISIDNFLHEHRVKGVRHSHVSMGQMKGKYEFNRPDLEIFWKLYMNTIKDNINHNKQVELCHTIDCLFCFIIITITQNGQVNVKQTNYV